MRRLLVLPAALIAPLSQPTRAQQDVPIHAAVGVCLRWGADPDHVEEAVVVVPSGEEAIDAGMPGSIRRMAWRRPIGSSYHGQWIGIWMALGDNVSRGELPQNFPDCSGLPPPPRSPTA